MAEGDDGLDNGGFWWHIAIGVLLGVIFVGGFLWRVAVVSGR